MPIPLPNLNIELETPRVFEEIVDMIPLDKMKQQHRYEEWRRKEKEEWMKLSKEERKKRSQEA